MTLINPQPSFHALIPAAGSGSRMGSELPKQYIDLLGRPVIRHTLDALLAVGALSRVWVVLAPDDAHWTNYQWPSDPRITVLRCGGATRAESVANALQDVAKQTDPAAWMLVHDAARACVSPQLVARMIEELSDDPVGGLLAVPVADTLKRAGDDGRVAQTIPRAGLWQAQTPQMFRLGMLREALAAHPDVTDEAGAIEACGLSPRLIASDATNFKVTFPDDLAMAARLLLSSAAELQK
ncbi:2-C-methyl-D-erythritol 4-phosphate cytidylyltransferase [Niveibacterium microcysteis]|uniref:2-C-methyl-D-erythritol 4-phosphate cytidylyltransferase n=1 Tax=Niveibacterium microcysteis TaxID=2811415 RepID=A0ABX7M3R9_9RHOO|nr:2-C-methyl-D-erythritol 4-phosphate cytidylyltransferase [Niveibacterium microcysteis]QSI75085.1 2-C-methyl-D-erythritol 4-phosphate cytidylyltransferase [Niveibacterium microcysteis]